MEDSISKLTFNELNHCFIPNPLDFEPSEVDVEESKFIGVSNMSNLFYPSTHIDREINFPKFKPDVDSIKMFVGQIPQNFNECDLLEIFEKFGKVYELSVLRDKTTGKSKGCCFVTFFTRKDALNTQNALHNNLVLPGMLHPIQMKPADTENKNDKKLFVGMLSRKISESYVRNMFSPFGTIEECVVLRDANRQSRGCAFVTYLNHKSAQNAIKSMHHCHIFEGCSLPIVVKLADTQRDKEIRRMQHSQNEFPDPTHVSAILHRLSADSLSTLVASNHLLQQLQNSGYINMNPQFILNLPNSQISNWGISPNESVNLQSPTSRCLINQFPNHSVAPITAHETMALNNILAQLSGAVSSGLLPQVHLENVYPSTSIEQMAKSQSWDKLLANKKQIEGPEGANLFIYHLPNEFTDQNLAELFNPYGKVLSVKVFIDKITKQSKCFGFVSYDNPLSAKAAIQKLNGYHILGKKLKVDIKRKKQNARC